MNREDGEEAGGRTAERARHPKFELRLPLVLGPCHLVVLAQHKILSVNLRVLLVVIIIRVERIVFVIIISSQIVLVCRRPQSVRGLAH
jgi:hypothetical protein